jgi:hypothetical protein
MPLPERERNLLLSLSPSWKGAAFKPFPELERSRL